MIAAADFERRRQFAMKAVCAESGYSDALQKVAGRKQWRS